MKCILCSQIIHCRKTEATLRVSTFVAHSFIVVGEIAMFSIREKIKRVIYLAFDFVLEALENVNVGC